MASNAARLLQDNTFPGLNTPFKIFCEDCQQGQLLQEQQQPPQSLRQQVNVPQQPPVIQQQPVQVYQPVASTSATSSSAILVNDPDAVPPSMVRIETALTATQPKEYGNIPFPVGLVYPKNITRQQKKSKMPFPVQIPGPKNQNLNLPPSPPILISGNFGDNIPIFIVYKHSDLSEYPLDRNPFSNQSHPSSNTSDAHSSDSNWKIPGISWYTESGANGLPGIENSCVFDTFVTAVRIQFARSGYDHMALLKSKTGQGKLVEDYLRITLHVVEVGGFEYSRDGDVFIKFLWINFVKLKSPFVQQLKYDMTGSEYSAIFQHIEDLTRIKLIFVCSYCKKKNPKNPPPEREHVAYSFCLTSCDSTEINDCLKKHPCIYMHQKTCPTCNTKSYVCIRKEVPDTTWVLTFWFDLFTDPVTKIKDLNRPHNQTKTFDHKLFPNLIYFGKVWWRKVYLSYHVEYNQKRTGVTGHLVSFHIIKGKEYQYDDLENGGQLTRALIRDFQKDPIVSVDRIVYFRLAPRSVSYFRNHPIMSHVRKRFLKQP